MQSQAIRMCVACRQRGSQKTLIRVVCDGVRAVLDPTQTAPGRGVYLHANPECIESALKRKLFGRALRVGTPISTEAVSELLNTCQ